MPGPDVYSPRLGCLILTIATRSAQTRLEIGDQTDALVAQGSGHEPGDLDRAGIFQVRVVRTEERTDRARGVAVTSVPPGIGQNVSELYRSHSSDEDRSPEHRTAHLPHPIAPGGDSVSQANTACRPG